MLHRLKFSSRNNKRERKKMRDRSLYFIKKRQFAKNLGKTTANKASLLAWQFETLILSGEKYDSQQLQYK
ncbi:hypothetical protein HT664_08320 [Ursidibacter maritimus]|uniref:Uncharacterized protein n=2 Tax=Ursidibacter maritimus TaxID=1331689 RepID=A0A949WG58_9PAST|nr:hypothetical protein [Ursidibacter maritimus]MBV6524725.1 hypothetical protein [Ursidibacter maritimus]MBV6527007.1 hypothetical protein [Ursidibacter maritimus]MBV6528780.1 hypothetical protein [Ursidibacter maritimus]MBV6532833.1 hypothetical protein [Ursidibacter maritimus]MBV6540064.1 hypothetical protein [Ursidibacter maritimus]